MLQDDSAVNSDVVADQVYICMCIYVRVHALALARIHLLSTLVLQQQQEHINLLRSECNLYYV